MSLIVAAPSITDWMSGVGAVLGVFVAIAVGALTVHYAARAVSRMRIAAKRDPSGSVEVEVTNTGKDAIEIRGVEFVARGSCAARLLNRLLFRSTNEIRVPGAKPPTVQFIAPNGSYTWRITVPALTNWPLPPTLLHPISTARRGTLSKRRLALRISRGQNRRPRYRWYSRLLPIRKIGHVSHTLAPPAQ